MNMCLDIVRNATRLTNVLHVELSVFKDGNSTSPIQLMLNTVYEAVHTVEEIGVAIPNKGKRTRKINRFQTEKLR